VWGPSKKIIVTAGSGKRGIFSLVLILDGDENGENSGFNIPYILCIICTIKIIRIDPDFSETIAHRQRYGE
jgi:hypothetical protein